MSHTTKFLQQEHLLVDDQSQAISKHSLKLVEREIGVHRDRTICGKTGELSIKTLANKYYTQMKIVRYQ